MNLLKFQLQELEPNLNCGQMVWARVALQVWELDAKHRQKEQTWF